MHLGAKQADVGFIKEHVARIAADPDGRYVYLGDGGECTTKVSKGELYEQKLSPDEQVDAVVELLEPIRGKGLFGVSGNHDRRISKLSGLDWTKALCTRLEIPYMGIACFMKLSMKSSAGSTGSLSYDLFWHHGTDSSSLLGGKIRAAKKLEQLVTADAIFSAHSHICLEVPPTYMACLPSREKKIAYRAVECFVCGCAYDSRVTGYAEEKGYSPILPAYLGVTFHNSHPKTGKSALEIRRTSCEIWRKQL